MVFLSLTLIYFNYYTIFAFALIHNIGCYGWFALVGLFKEAYIYNRCLYTKISFWGVTTFVGTNTINILFNIENDYYYLIRYIFIVIVFFLALVFFIKNLDYET